MSKRKIARRPRASRRIYYHLALRDTEVRTARRATPIYIQLGKTNPLAPRL